MIYSLAKHGAVGHGANHRLFSDFYLLPSSPHSLQLLHAGSSLSPTVSLFLPRDRFGSCHACLLARLRTSPLFQEVMLPPSHCLFRPRHVFFLAMLFSEIIRFPLIDSLTRKEAPRGWPQRPLRSLLRAEKHVGTCEGIHPRMPSRAALALPSLGFSIFLFGGICAWAWQGRELGWPVCRSECLPDSTVSLTV